MTFDNMEAQSLNVEKLDSTSHLKGLNSGIETKTVPIDGCYQNMDLAFDQRVAQTLGIDDTVTLKALHPTLMDQTRDMLYGVEKNGFKTQGLTDLSKYALSPEYYETNLKQQSGFAAEIISTYKENLVARAKGSDITTYRTDDLPELFNRNDPFVDKVRMNSNGKIVEQIQTKFVGKNGKEWLSKMMSSKFEKYLNGEVDKLECPKEFYDDIKAAIPERVSKLERQLERVKSEGKTDVAKGIQKRIDKLGRIDEMLEQSNTTTNEAIFARLHPKCAAAKMFASETVKLSNREGLKGGAFAAGLTFTVSTVDNISSYMEGEITAEEMVKDIITETATAGALEYSRTFVSRAVSQAMRASSSQLIQRVGGSCLPAETIAFAVESYDSISSFAQGEIDGATLAYDLGENASSIAGAIEGAAIGASVGAKIGAVVGTAISPAGTVAGGTIGCVSGSVVGGMVGCVVASEIYTTAVQVGSEHIGEIADAVQGYVDLTIDSIAEIVPDQLNDAKLAFNDFASSFNLSIHI